MRKLLLGHFPQQFMNASFGISTLTTNYKTFQAILNDGHASVWDFECY